MDEDEELLGPPPRQWPRWQRAQRWRRPLAALAGFAVLGAGAITISRSGTDQRPKAEPTPSSISLSSLRPVRLPQADSLPTDTLIVPEAQLPLCPIGSICETSYSLPHAVYAGLRTGFPDLQVAASRTLVARRSADTTVLVARVIALRTAQLSGSIEIRRPEAGDADAASVEDDQTHVAGEARARTGGYVITVRVVGRTGVRLRVDLLQELVTDPRLLARPAANRAQSDDEGQR